MDDTNYYQGLKKHGQLDDHKNHTQTIPIFTFPSEILYEDFFKLLYTW
jgi:hypothetical protein